MRALKDNEIQAEFMSSWDSGNVTIYSPCIINKDTKEVVKIYRRGREVYATNDDINASNVDDNIDTLDEQMIYLAGQKYPVVQKDDLKDDQTYWYK